MIHSLLAILLFGWIQVQINFHTPVLTFSDLFYVFYRMKHVHLHQKIKAIKQNPKEKQKQLLTA